MTMLRTDLIDLGPDALMALANPGFVKRAQKDVAAGALPGLSQDPDGTVHARFGDGVHTRMAPGVALRDAECSCTAGGMCRHRVMLVLAYQAAHVAAAPAATDAPDTDAPDAVHAGWSPAHFDDAAIAAAVGPAVVEQARKLALDRPVATVMTAAAAGGVPAVSLPMSQVRFFAAGSLALARCDCRQGSGCAHVVLACWAFRQARRAHPDAPDVTLDVHPFGAPPAAARAALMDTDAARRVRAQAEDWLWSVWREGASQPAAGLEARHAALTADLAQLGWTWVREDIENVWQILGALARRSSRYGTDDLVDASARAYLRLAGAAHADAAPAPRLPASRILGIGQQGEVALDLLRLVSLGMTCWRDDAGLGARIVFADPDTQAVCVLDRAWPAGADAGDPGTGLLDRRVAGVALRALAGGQVVTRAARRRANASVELGAGARQTSVLALSPKSWDDLRAPLRFDTLDALLAHLRGRPPAGILPGEAAGNWHVIGLAGLTLEDWTWDGVRQALCARWRDDAGRELRAHLRYESLAPGAVDALARALRGDWGAPRALAGPVWRENGGIAIRPASIVTGTRAVVLALEPKAPQALVMDGAPPAGGAAAALLDETRALLGQIVRYGLRHVPPALRSRTLAQAAHLDDAGYVQAAGLLRAALAERRDGTGLAALSLLGLLLVELTG